ncbi:hypothetical protein C5B42_03145 [Candidatus Cerribacteria bacterium 'Amazon FNV 2010 28 9']|uniref:Uncharacterized protein n=1 Tax=Candidatus Cerribacteria bacterium 'Amazon FNV 2010 28 9' TaxID=2081795 RepID=A0A317JNR3_9BACT|nr:MAG: hypothetical protein C5B42_03145 [Candidatus Cerribacteria bacterium 'Amazon FNV 2010 28 9']
MATKKNVTKPVEHKEEETLLGQNTVVTLTIPWNSIDTEYKKVLQTEAGKVQLAGFRKGKTPISLAESAIGKEKLMEHALQHAIPEIYAKELEAQGIVPLVNPEVKLLEATEGKDFVIEAHTAVEPTVVLGDYKAIVKKAARAASRAVPEPEMQSQVSGTKTKENKEVTDEKKPEEKEEELLQAIYSGLIIAIKPKVAPLLLQEEMRRQAEQMFSQISRLGMKDIKEYLERVGKTEEEFEQDLASVALGALQLEFILRALAKDMHIEATDEAIKEVFPEIAKWKNNAIPENLRPQLEQAVIRKKVASALLKLST